MTCRSAVLALPRCEKALGQSSYLVEGPSRPSRFLFRSSNEEPTLMRAAFRSAAVIGGLLCLAGGPARADEIPAEYRETVTKGLKWMAEQQHKDGHWEAFGGQYPITMTALGGMACCGREHRPRGQVQGQHPPRRRLACVQGPAQRHARQPGHSRRGGPVHVRPRLRHDVPRLRLRRGRRHRPPQEPGKNPRRSRQVFARRPDPPRIDQTPRPGR